jgi:hypothetical protein
MTMSAGTHGIIDTHTSSIPTKPIHPNWLNPRNWVTVSDPYAIDATHAPTSSARSAFWTASRDAPRPAPVRARGTRGTARGARWGS